MIDSTTNVSGASSRWSEGLEEESAFWLRWLSSGGEPWREDFVRRTTADFELQWHIQRYLPSADDAELEILDVGSGPLTVLGKRWGNRRLHITAVDPLADMYDRHLAATGITPIVRTIRGEAERIADQFPHNHFDLVYAQNCIDHGYDPLLAILQMLKLTKLGCYVMLEHAINEGEYMKYAGPHQWNFCVEDGRFVIWRPGLKVDAHGVLSRLAEVELQERADIRWLVVALKKRG